jgi:hypothetical protein
MPSISAWLGNPMTIEKSRGRAAAAWKRIQDKPTTVVFNRDGDDLDEQIVRVEFNSGGSDGHGPTATTSQQGLVLYGVKDHESDDVPDTDMQRADRFWMDDKEFEITVVVNTFGEVQGFAEATG